MIMKLSFRILALRAGVISSPALLFLYGMLGVSLLSPVDGSVFVESLAYSHLFGALPGLVVALAHVSQGTAPRPGLIRWQIVLTMLASMAVAYVVTHRIDAATLSLTAAASAFFDTFAKRFRSDVVVPFRLFQAAVTTTLLLAIYLMPNLISLTFFLLGRSAINAIVLIALPKAIARPKSGATDITRAFNLSLAFKSYVWMLSSNGTFLAPVLFITRLSPGSATSFVAYALQTALQLAGRFSDYLTLNAIRNKPLRIIELSLTIIMIIGVLVAVLIPGTRLNHIDFGALVTLVILLSVAVVAWGIADSHLTTKAYRIVGNFSVAARAGAASLLTVGLICAGALLYGLPISIFFLAAAAAVSLGALSYAICAYIQ